MVILMQLREVLSLNMVSGSIKKIDLFLAGTNKKSIDYYQAFCYRNIILHHLGRTNEALKAVYSLVVDFPKLSDDIIIVICDAIIKITLDINRLDQSKKYMDVKKSHLKISNQVLGLKDDIVYELACKNAHTAIEKLKLYLNDEISLEETIWAYEELASIYYSIHSYDAYLKTTELLERNYKESFNTKKLILLLYSRLVIADEQGHYLKVISDANELLNDYELEDDIALKTATLLIKSYLACKDYHKASIIESNFEEKMKVVSDDIALEFAKICVQLYTQNNSLFNATHYQNLVEQFNQTRKKTKSKEKLKQPIVIPSLNEGEEAIEDSNELAVQSTPTIEISSYTPHVLTVSSQYEKLEKLFMVLNNQASNLKFREKFRLTMIELAKIVPFEEAYLLFYHQGYSGLHYKKDRAYDKILDLDTLENTINFAAMTKEQEIFLSPLENLSYRDIVLKDAYEEVPYGIALPLSKEDVVYASIAFWSKKAFLSEELVYETLKLISQMINKALIEELVQRRLRLDNKKMFFIYENMTAGIKELMDGHIHLSKQATQILGSFEDLSEQEYKNLIHESDLPLYQTLVEELYQYLPNHKSLEYRFKKNGSYITVKETFYPSLENGSILLYSLIEDVSKRIELQENLVSLAYTNPISKLSTEVKLMVDLEENITLKKLTLAVLDVHDFKLYEELYGMNFANQLIYAIAIELKTAFSEQFQVNIYHLGFDRYAILFKETNDKRTIDNLLLKALEQVSKKLTILNSRVKLYFNVGIYRVSKSQVITADKVVAYAFDALNDAKLSKDLNHHLEHYDGEKSKLRFNENQLVTHISEAIDFGKIAMTYKQVVDLKRKEVFAYYAQISLDNFDVDTSYLDKVIKRRNLEEMMDKYKISNASREIRLLRENTNAKLYILIELNKITITEQLICFIETQNQFYKTTKSNILFIVEDASNPVIMALRRMGYLIASTNLIDVYQEYCQYYIFNMELYGSVVVPELQQLCKAKHISLILSHIDTKEDMNRAIQMNVQYLFGGYYKKTIRMKKVIEKLS